MRSFSIKIIISSYFIFLVGGVKAQGNVVSRSAELDSLKSIRLKSPQRAVRYARQVLSELNPEQSTLESKILNILGEIYVDLYLPSIALQYFIDAGHKSNVRKNPWNKINIGNVCFCIMVSCHQDWAFFEQLYGYFRLNMSSCVVIHV